MNEKLKYKCYSCGKKATYFQDNIEFYIPIYRCESCGLLQTERMPDGFLKKYTTSDYSALRSKHVSDEYLAFAELRGVDQRAFVEEVTGEQVFASVLDFGGGYGGGLAAFPESDKYLYDPDPNAEQHLEALQNITILGDKDLRSPAYEKKFDLIILSHVFEHLSDPLCEIEKLQSLLKDDGYLFIEVPTEDEDVLKMQTRSLQPGLGHLFHFNHKTLKSVLEKTDAYNIVATGQFGIDKVSFYDKHEKMNFDVGQNSVGIWLRAVLRRDAILVEPKKRVSHSRFSVDIIERLHSAAQRRRADILQARKGYHLISGFINEAVPPADHVLGLDKDNIQKFYYMIEKCDHLVVDLRAQLRQSLSSTALIEAVVRREFEARLELMRTELDKTKAELSVLREGESEKDRQISQLVSSFGALEGATHQKTDELQALLTAKTQQIQDLLSARDEQETQLLQKERQIADIELQSDMREENIGKLRAELASVQSEFIAMQNKIEAADAELAALRTQLDDLQSALQCGNQEIAVLKTNAAKGAEECEVLTLKNKSIVQQAERVRNEKEALSNSFIQKAVSIEAEKVRAQKRAAQAVEDRQRLHSVAHEVINSTSFKLGSLITLPMRYAKIGSKAFDAVSLPPLEEGSQAKGQNRRDVSPLAPASQIKPTHAVGSRTGFSGYPGPEHAANPVGLDQSGSFYQKNGFAVFRQLIPPQEALAMSKSLSNDFIDGEIDPDGHTTFDVGAVHPQTSDYVFDTRVRKAVSTCLGEDIRFLQWATFQKNHMSLFWHRDGAYRTFGKGLDWEEDQHTYKVCKIILYLEVSNFAMALFPRSHREPIDRAKIPREQEAYAQFDLTAQHKGELLKQAPYLAYVQPGDALIFDQRLFHCGRAFDPATGKFSKKIHGNKVYLSYTYGADNPHSSRFFSYFNKEREFNIQPMQKQLTDRLSAEGLYLSTGQKNYFDLHPEQRQHLWLKNVKVDS